MKQRLLILIFLSFIFNCQAQWTTSGNNIYNTNTGNAGIGTSAPTAKLTVSSNTTGPVGSFQSSVANDRARLNIANIFNNASKNASSALTFSGYNYSGSAVDLKWEIGTDLSTNGVNNLYFFNYANSQIAFFVKDNGFVGIGTTNPQEALSVNGKIRSKQVVVETSNWPDFVFKRNYDLKPLSWVQAFVEKNNHLPEIPSAIAIESNGQNLGEMNRLLLKKVEELTLYLIELDKKVETQNKEIARLKKKK